MKIDWNEAPEWAVAHALYTFVNQITPVWVGVDQWQDVVRGKPFPYGGGTGEYRHNPTRKQFQYETPRPAPWNGKGLPPVGTVCEHRTGHGMAWSKATVLAYGEKKAFYRDRDGHEWTRLYDEIEFRPIRTPGQIAAEQYERDAEEIAKILDALDGGDNNFIAKTLLDCGYARKVNP